MATRITIRGRQYTVRSDDDGEDLQEVAKYVDAKMAEVARSTFDEYTIAMIAALNIASEYDRFRREVAGRLDDLDREAAAVGAILEAALPEEEGEA